MEKGLPPELRQLAAQLAAEPAHIQQLFRYALAVSMCKRGTAHLASAKPGPGGALLTFETVAGDTFTIQKPALATAQETKLLAKIYQILNGEL
jgi:hypothetical protein